MEGRHRGVYQGHSHLVLSSLEALAAVVRSLDGAEVVAAAMASSPETLDTFEQEHNDDNGQEAEEDAHSYVGLVPHHNSNNNFCMSAGNHETAKAMIDLVFSV